MSIPFRGFCGPSYQLTDKYAAIERTVGWHLVPNEHTREETKGDILHEPTPGNARFCTLPVPAPFNQPNRGLIECREGAYGVNGNVAFYIDNAGNFTNLGNVVWNGNAVSPVSMVPNGNKQIFVSDPPTGKGYVIGAAGAASTFTTIANANFLGAAYSTFQDGYILVVTPNTNQFQISGDDTNPIGDATIWSSSNVSIQAGMADLLRAILSNREYIRIFGYRRSQVYANTGAAGFPFQIYNDTFIETGLAATFSVANLGDAGLMWIGQDARGIRAAWIDPAMQPQRASTFAVEQAWESYASIDDAVAFPYLWRGHLIYRITFPSAKIDGLGNKTAATWEYDVTASQLTGLSIWTEQQHSNPQNYLVGRPELYHCYAYGKHLVGSVGTDGNPGAIYQWSANQYTDCGTDSLGNQVQKQIVRDRICPHLWESNHRLVYNKIEFEVARGVGLDGAPGVGTNPQLYLAWSNDAGNSYGAWRNMAVGALAAYNQRVYFTRVGYARDRVFWARYSDPTYMAFVAATLDLFECAS